VAAVNDVNGTPGNDFLKGTTGVDQINAMAGHDIIDAKGGDDRIVAGAGSDLVFGGSGNDTVVATINDGHDVYHGDGGSDTFDFSQTSAAATVRLGTAIFDTTLMTSAARRVHRSAPTCCCRSRTWSAARATTRSPATTAPNVLRGSAGNDVMTGGAGSDTFMFKPAFGNDRLTDFDGNPAGGQDQLDIRAFGIATANEFDMRVDIDDAGADTLVTIDGTQTIHLSGVGDHNTITVDDFRFD
jgi:Ca2+-binding RTX toxin-like protein